MTFYELITAAIADIERYGYDSQNRIDDWLDKIAESARESMTSTAVLEDELRRAFTSTYDRMVGSGRILKNHSGLSAYRLNMIKPKLHAELQRRIMSSSNLIKLNRSEMMNRTMQRFSGWATSVPPGGSKVTDTMEVKNSVSKALKNLPFTERRVMIDQGHKFVSELNRIVARDGGAIAGRWRSHYRQAGYNYRPDHKERDGLVYAIRGNWAIEQGLMNKGESYTDEITAAGEEVFCRCQMIYIYGLGKLPINMLTSKGEAELKRAKGIINADN